MRWAGRGIFAIFLLAILAGAALGGLILSQDPNAIALRAAQAIERQTGAKVQMQGEAGWAFRPLPVVETGPLRAATRDGAIRLTAETAALGLDYLGLLRGRVGPGTVTLDDVSGVIDAAALPAPDVLGHAALPHNLTLRRAALRLDGLPGGPETIAIEIARLHLSGPDAALSLALTGTWRERRAALDLTLETPGALAAGRAAVLSLEITQGDDRFAYSGWLRRDAGRGVPQAEGRIDMALADLAGTLAWLGADIAVPPVARLEATADIVAVPARLWLDLRATGDVRETTVSATLRLSAGRGWAEVGAADVELVSRAGGLYSAYLGGTLTDEAAFQGKLEAAVLDLPALSAWLSGRPPPAWAEWQRLSVQGDVAAAPGRVALGPVRAALDEAVVTGDLTATFAGPATEIVVPRLVTGLGDLSAELLLQPGGRIAGRLRGTEIDLAALSAAVGAPGYAGALSGEVRFVLPDGLADLADALTLEGPISVFGGALPIADLLGLADGTAAGGEATAFRTLTGTLTAANGRARLGDVRLGLDGRAFDGLAEVDLATGTLSARLVPRPADDAVRGVLIGGTLGRPTARTEPLLEILQATLPDGAAPRAAGAAPVRDRSALPEETPASGPPAPPAERPSRQDAAAPAAAPEPAPEPKTETAPPPATAELAGAGVPPADVPLPPPAPR